MKEDISFPWMNEYGNQLNLQWQVSLSCDTEKDWWILNSNRVSQRHEIMLAYTDRNNMDAILVETTRYLCMAKHAEDIDPLLSSLYYSPAVAASTDQRTFQNRYIAMYLSLPHIFIWGEDLREQRWGALTIRDHRYLRMKLTTMMEKTGIRAIELPSTLLTIARYKAHYTRYDMQKDELYHTIKRIEAVLNRSRRASIDMFTDRFEKLPKRPESREHALVELEKNAVLMAYCIDGMFGNKVTIHPRICLEKNSFMWRF